MCFRRMGQQMPASDTSYVVSRPRASDAIGCALRNAYGEPALPDDMAELLARLNGNGGMRSTNH